MTEVSEHERLSALRAYGVLDTDPEASFDEIARAAAAVCQAPIAAISLVDEVRQWFKAEVGLGVRETPRDVSFCKYAMRGDALYVVPDAQTHPLFATNALVTGDPKIRFYAGAPIRTPDGVPLGALCVIDTQVRPQGLSEAQTAVLQVLARQVEAQLSLRRLIQDQTAAAASQAAKMEMAAQREERLVAALASAEVGWWDWDVPSNLVRGSVDLARDYGVSPAAAERGMPIEAFFANVHPADLSWLRDAIDDAVASGGFFAEEYRILRPDGEVHWTSARGRCLRDEEGKPWRFPGVATNITDRRRTEDRLREADVGRELAMQAAQLGLFDHNPSRRERHYDARALEMVGMTQEEIQDPSFVLSHVHPEDRAALEQKLAAVVDPKRTGQFRHSYRVFHPRTGAERWLNVVGTTQFVDGVCTRFMGVFEDVTDAKKSEQHRRLLANELNHRMKNTLAIVLSIVDNSLRSAADTASARDDIGGRIRALGRANDLLTAESWSAASVSEIVQGVVETLTLPIDRLELTGEAVRLGPGPALQLALTLHELATNAVKYGALSNDTGKVSMSWGVAYPDGGATFSFDWRERGGPTVVPPTRQGFGTRLIQRATAAAFNGEASLDHLPKGVHWGLRAPYSGLAEMGRSEE